MVAEPTRIRAASLDDVADVVTRYYGITVDDLRADNRAARLAEPRQVFMFTARHCLAATHQEIGSYLLRDHSTVHHGVERIGVRRLADEMLAADLSAITGELAASLGMGAPPVTSEPPVVQLFGELQVNLGRYVGDLRELLRVIDERGVPEGAWFTGASVGPDSIRLTLRWQTEQAQVKSIEPLMVAVAS